MSKLFRTFSQHNPSTQNDLANKEETMHRASTQSSYADRTELPATNLNSDVEIKGSIRFNESLRLDGTFEGELTSESGLLIIGKNGNIRATISVGSAIVEGKLSGNIHAKDKIELRSSAQHFGDIKASRLIVEEGVVFVGKCDVNPQQTKIEPIRPESSLDSEEEEPLISEEEEDLQEDFLRKP